jgi:SAM-dependent methyltransferase
MKRVFENFKSYFGLNNAIHIFDELSFDELSYLAAYPDVAIAVKSGTLRSGCEHYKTVGYTEGRIAGSSARPTPINFPFQKRQVVTRRDKLLANLDLEILQGLEIGALASPLVRPNEGNIIFVDHVDTEQLINKYAKDPTVSKANIVKIDAVWGAQSLQTCIGDGKKVDYVLASHVIEHVPDLVTWLSEIRSILRSSGTLRLAIPDKRYTFDIIRNESDMQDVLDAYLRRVRAPLPRMILEHYGLVRAVDCATVWRGKAKKISQLPAYHSWAEALDHAKRALEDNSYHDCHCWVFTPRSFAKLCVEMALLDLLDFACDYHIDTAPNNLEFFVSMSPSDDKKRILDSWSKMEKSTGNGKNG